MSRLRLRLIVHDVIGTLNTRMHSMYTLNILD